VGAYLQQATAQVVVVIHQLLCSPGALHFTATTDAILNVCILEH
jgi:hypothetical protein